MNKEEIDNMYKVLTEQWGDSDNYINDLLIYSKDLQQENKQLKERIDTLKETQIKQLQIIKDKDEVIDKVIEIAKEKIKRYESYINDLKNGNYPSPIIRQERQELMFRIREQEELLEILKGE